MATDNSHSLWRKCCPRIISAIFNLIFSIQGTTTYIRARMNITLHKSSKFSQIRPRAAELYALERLKKPYRLIMGKWCPRIISAIFNLICSILARNNNIHKISNEIEIQPDPTTCYGVICP